MALDLQPPDGRKRVKVYELRDNDWFDRGTGFCTGQTLGVSSLSLGALRAFRDHALGADRPLPSLASQRAKRKHQEV